MCVSVCVCVCESVSVCVCERESERERERERERECVSSTYMGFSAFTGLVGWLAQAQAHLTEKRSSIFDELWTTIAVPERS